MRAQRSSPLPYILLALLAAAIAAGVVLSALAFSESRRSLELAQKSLALLEQLTAEEDDTAAEDDVTIMESYTIRSTVHISDAYRSGDPSALDDKDRETLDMAAAVLAEVVSGGMSAFEKEKAVYDWMTRNLRQDRGLLTVIPTTQADCDNPYGTLKYRNAVCVGYATTFRLFMQMLDIPCKVVHNTNLVHTWDLVQLDGDWYHTDIWSDVGRGDYASFNQNDAIRSRYGYEWDTSFFPSATSLRYNMAYQNSVEGCDVYEFPAMLRAAVDGKQPILALRYGPDFTERQASILSEMSDRVRSRLWNTEGYTSVELGSSFFPADGGWLFVVNLTFPSNEDRVVLTEEELWQIEGAVDGAFWDLGLDG